jgi:ketosteroid isomerase-like protein
MNTKHLILVLIFTLFLSACGAPAIPVPVTAEPTAASAVPTSAPDPITIAKTFYQAFNDKDLDKARSLIAEDYVMNDPSGTYDRAAAMIQWQAVIDSGITFNPTNFVDTGNGRVTSCYEVFQNGDMIDKGCGSVTRVRDGKIVFDGLEDGERIWIAHKWNEATNLEEAMALLAEDVKMRGGAYINGKDRFRFYIQGTLNRDGHGELSDLQVEGDKVTYRWEAFNSDGNIVASGVETLHIKDGLIVLIE